LRSQRSRMEMLRSTSSGPGATLALGDPFLRDRAHRVKPQAGYFVSRR
jgi:hypothetical protein